MKFAWIGYGLIIWIIPLVISFFFYSAERELITSYALFKSVMVVVLTLTTVAINLFRPVKTVHPFLVATMYTTTSIALDLLVVLPMTGLRLSEYMEQIPLIYIIIFALTWSLLREPKKDVVVKAVS